MRACQNARMDAEAELTRTGIIDGGLGSRRLATPRLSLRWMMSDDAALLSQYGRDPLIVQKTETIAYPYDEAMAGNWIAESDVLRKKGMAYRFAVTDRLTGAFMGVCGLTLLDGREDAAALGYWLGRPYWDKGYGREAVSSLIAFGRDILGLKSVQATVFVENTASIAVLRGQGFSESAYDVLDVPERGGNRLVRQFSLEFAIGVGSQTEVSSCAPSAKARVA